MKGVVVKFQRGPGFTSLNSAIGRKLMRAILNTDGYRLYGQEGEQLWE